MEVLPGQVLMGELWNLGIYGKVVRGFSIGSSRTADPSLLKGFWCSSSGHVHPGPWVLWWQVHETLVPGVTGGQISFLCACFGCVTCGFGLLSLQSNSSC